MEAGDAELLIGPPDLERNAAMRNIVARGVPRDLDMEGDTELANDDEVELGCLGHLGVHFGTSISPHIHGSSIGQLASQLGDADHSRDPKLELLQRAQIFKVDLDLLRGNEQSDE